MASVINGSNIILYYTDSNRKYYFNGISKGIIGGNQFYQISTTSIATGYYSRYDQGLLTSFITDIGDPSQKIIRSGVWTFQNYFQITSNTQYNPYIYYKIYKYDGTTFTLIGTSNQTPLTTINEILYTTTFNCPETTLAENDRIAIEIWTVNNFLRDVTLNTAGTKIGSVVTTLNGLSVPFGASTNCSFEVSVDQKEVTSQACGYFRSYKNDMSSWKINCDGFIALRDYSYLFLAKLQLDRKPILVKFQIDNDNGDGSNSLGYTVFNGLANLESLSLSGPVEGASTYSVSLQGSGAYTISGTQATPTGIVVTGSNVVMQQYVAAGGELSITFASMIGYSCLSVTRGGIEVRTISTSGTPTGEDIVFNSSTGTLTFARALESDEFVRGIFK